jgi:saccharopine dehydrogenase-like NADP-dependent oxidoreductase
VICFALIIAVTGGTGLTGQCAVRDLLRNRKVERVVVADLDGVSLKKLGKTLDDGRIYLKKVDVRNHEATADAIKGCDVVVNGVQYYFNLDVMSAALAAGVNYLDFGGLYHTTLRQIRAFRQKFGKKKILGLLGMGAQPGVSNLMVKHSTSLLDRVETIEIRDAWRDFTKTDSPMYFTWSPQTLFDEATQDAIVYEKGRYVVKPPLSEPETVRFPAPVGSVPVYLALHSELATIPQSFAENGVKNVSWKEGSEDFWKTKFLADLGLVSDKEIPIGGGRVSPRKFFLSLLSARGGLRMPIDAVPNDFEITRVVSYGWKDGRKSRIVVDTFFPAYKPWRVSCSQYNVGIPASIAAQKIASEGDLLPKGVLPPERVFDPSPFFRELEKRKITVKRRFVA